MSSKLLATVPSQSNPSKSYEIKEGADHTIYCSCPAWKFQRVTPGKNQRTCKHLKAFFAGQLASKAEQPVISKSVAGHLLATAASKVENAKEAERKFQAAKKAQSEAV
jgi:hypothetical protein